MTVDFPARCAELLAELGLNEAGAPLSVTPLSGGVASDIAKVTVGQDGSSDQKTYCVKFALAKLRVKADWFAPVTRSFAEYQWLKTAAQISPDTAIQLYGHSERLNGFVMSYLQGEETGSVCSNLCCWPATGAPNRQTWAGCWGVFMPPPPGLSLTAPPLPTVMIFRPSGLSLPAVYRPPLPVTSGAVSSGCRPALSV